MKTTMGKRQTPKHWLLISLHLPSGSVEAVSNFLMEQGATGIEEDDEGQKKERLRAYFACDGREGAVLRSLRRYLRSLGAIEPEICQAKVETFVFPEQDWGETWKRFFKPLRVTSRVIVSPPWFRPRLRKKEISILINPGMAFGTGTHPTTKLCIRALEKGLGKKRLSVLDVGTGSGILSIGAAQMGAGIVIGVDSDPLAVQVARENVEWNRLCDFVQIRKGSIGRIRGQFDVVVANIDFKGVRRMRKPLLRRLKRKGLLILSGLLEGEDENLRRYYMETGLLKRGHIMRERGWVCLNFRKK